VTKTRPVVTRFAPSPTGPLHLGHAFSAIVAHDIAAASCGTFLLRIDDLDLSRARPAWETQLKDDLRWLGLEWPEPCRRESEHFAAYDAALDQLWAEGLLFTCTCSRRDIREALSAPQEGAPQQGPDGLVYPGTCRPTSIPTPPLGPRPKGATLRLNMSAAIDKLSTQAGQNAQLVASFLEAGTGPLGERGQIHLSSTEAIERIGDVVLARRDAGAAYHLAVVVDDAAQNVTHVVRGEDLFEATKIHVVLQRLLGKPTPVYHHHRLVRDDQGKRLAKRDDARALATYRAQGWSPTELRQHLGL